MGNTTTPNGKGWGGWSIVFSAVSPFFPISLLFQDKSKAVYPSKKIRNFSFHCFQDLETGEPQPCEKECGIWRQTNLNSNSSWTSH